MAKEEKLDWIYKSANSLVDREDYLLGRKVDRTLEQLNEEEKEKKFVLPTPKNHVEHECIPPSIRDFNKIVMADQVDLSAKLQEDPLVAIKKREEEARRQFLQNPVQLKKLQEAIKQQQEKKTKHKKSKKKHSDEDLDEKLREKFRLLKNNPLAAGMPKKATKKDSEDALNTILMHKFNALKEKLSEKDLQDILNGDVSDDSDEDKIKKKAKKKKRQESSDSESDKKKDKSKKSTNDNLSGHKEKIKKRGRSSSRDTDKEIEKISNRRKRDYSSEKDSRRSRSPNKKRDSYKSYSRESSSDKKYKNRDRAHSGRQFEQDRSRYKEKKLHKERSKSPIKRKTSMSRSNERTRKNEKKRRGDSRERQDSPKLTKQKFRRGRDGSSESDSDKYESSKGQKEKKDNNSDSDLDQKIMAKLRLLRGEVETKTNNDILVSEKLSSSKTQSGASISSDDDKYAKKQAVLPAKPPHLQAQNQNSDSSSSESSSNHKKMKTFLPEKPSHLRHRSESSDSSSSEEAAYKGKYTDSEEEQKQPKSFGLVTSDGKKIALKKATEQKNVDMKTFKKIEPTVKFEKNNVRKLSEKEKERLREEMVRNAEVRDKERERNVQRYREKDRKEEEMITKNFDADLVHNQLLKSAKHSSVEQRIKSNLNNIQRSSRHMDSNFSKR